MAYTIDPETDTIFISMDYSKSELDKLAKANGLSKDYIVCPIADTEEKEGNGSFYYRVDIDSDYWVHDVAN